MTPTEELKQEHRAIELMLDILSSVCQRLDRGTAVNPQHLEQILEFFRVFADKCHHNKEETHLFPALERAGVPKDGGPIGVMLNEHTEGRACIRGMGEAATQYSTGNLASARDFVNHARAYIDLLREHIQKEDTILFPMADMHLSDGTQQQLSKSFEQVENEIVGQGKHEEFHRLLNTLKGIYLS